MAAAMSEAPTAAGFLFQGPPAYQPRTPWHAAMALPATVAILVGSFLISFLVVLILPATGWGQALGLPPQAKMSDSGVLVLALFQTLTVALTLLACLAW